jgi:hypothetical protein
LILNSNIRTEETGKSDLAEGRAGIALSVPNVCQLKEYPEHAVHALSTISTLWLEVSPQTDAFVCVIRSAM